MGYPQGHKEQTRQRIIQAARRLWKRRGYGGASVDKVMEEANLTRGGFYAHFKSKDDLLTEVLSETLAVTTIERLRQEGVTDEKDLKKRILDFYISEQHCAFPEQGCPLTSLAQEGARFGKGPRRVLSRLVKRFGNWLGAEQDVSHEKKGLAVLSLMVGTVTLGRAIDDDGLRADLLAASKAEAMRMLYQNREY